MCAAVVPRVIPKMRRVHTDSSAARQTVKAGTKTTPLSGRMRRVFLHQPQADDAEGVAKPLDGGASDEDGASRAN